MLRRSFMTLVLALATSTVALPARAYAAGDQIREIDLVKIDGGLRLRRAIWRAPDPQGYVLLLHGFPETVHAWDGVAPLLAQTHEVHAFDWPGYGQSSRPPADEFGYAPRDYARVLKDYLAKSHIDRSRLTIYATDIGALPALLLALDDPGVAQRIIVGDFAPFDRPDHMYPSLQSLKSKETAGQIRAHINRTRDEILANTFYRGLPEASRYPIPRAFSNDLRLGWEAEPVTPADAFYHYYSFFTRDQNELEANLARLLTPLEVVWGEKDIYINKQMGAEFAQRVGAELTLLPDVGHYPHLQDPALVAQIIRRSFR